VIETANGFSKLVLRSMKAALAAGCLAYPALPAATKAEGPQEGLIKDQQITNDRSKPPIAHSESSVSLPALRADTIDEFLAKVGGTPRSQISTVQNAIARSKADSEMVVALTKRLLVTPVTDVNRHLMILSILGELKDPSTIPALREFIWSDRPLVPTVPVETRSGRGTSYFNHDGALRARAAEMLSFIGTREADEAILEIAWKHSGAEVRIAAIDAYLFNHSDSADAKEELIKRVRPEERKLVGLPRFKQGMDRAEFDRRVLDFYRLYPEEMPQAQKRLEDGTLQKPETRKFPDRPQDGSSRRR
jgi:HEAT repeat protein